MPNDAGGGAPIELLSPNINQRAEKVRYLVVAAVAIFALVGASAADVASGVDAYRQGDYATAIEWCLRAARRGFGPAQSNLGSLYLRGASNIETSPFEAHVWASLAEGQNFPGAKEMRMNAERMLSREEISEAAMP